MFRMFNPEMELENWNLIMASIKVDFTAQMRLGKDIEIKTWVKKIGRSSFTVYQEAWQGEAMGARGEAVCVHFDFTAQQSVTIPEEIRSQMQKHHVGE